MANGIQQGVADFHKKFGHPVQDALTIPGKVEVSMAFDFISEEVDELWDALYTPFPEDVPEAEADLIYEPDLIEVADALGDIVFVAYGMALRFGIDLDRVLAAIIESNMTKEPNGQGKIKKGEDYVPPKIAEALGLGPVEGFSPEGLKSIGFTDEGQYV